MGSWENAEISALCFYRVMKNVDKHLKQVRVGRGRLGTHSCSKDQKIVSSSLLTFCLCLEEGFTSFLIFFNIPWIIQMESLMRTYLLFENLWEKQPFLHFCWIKWQDWLQGFLLPVKAFRFVCDRTLHRGYFYLAWLFCCCCCSWRQK